MNARETTAILAVIRRAYPSFMADCKTAEDTKPVVNLWAEAFADDRPDVVGAAVKAFIVSDEKGFAPSIGQIKGMMRKLRESPDKMTPEQAWSLISKATRNGLYGAKEEFAKLPPLCKRIVGSPAQLHQWAMLDVDTLESVVASNFQRSYATAEEREEFVAALPESVKAVAGLLSERMSFDALPEAGG